MSEVLSIGTTYIWGNRPWHVRGIVDGMAVSRAWNVGKRRWDYEVHEPELFIVIRDRKKSISGSGEEEADPEAE